MSCSCVKNETSCVSCAPGRVGCCHNRPNASSDTVVNSSTTTRLAVSSTYGESSPSFVTRDFSSVHRSEVVGQVDVNDSDGYGGAAMMCNMDGSERTVRSATSVVYDEVSIAFESSSILFDIDSKLAEVYGEPL